MLIRSTQLTIVQGDITQLKVDAIVNAANHHLEMGGGVAGAIKRAAGVSVETEARALGPIAVGDAVATAGGRLSAKYIIHAATMGMDFKTDEHKIRMSCRNALRVADELNLKTIALPAMGCGVGGFPLQAAAKIMSQEVYRYARSGRAHLTEIVFCLYTQQAFDEFSRTVTGYVRHLLDDIQYGPFVTVDTIIELGGGSASGEGKGIVVIERSNPPFGYALPGGFVDYGESLEAAVVREAREETGLEVRLVSQFHTYSDPERDPRFHTIGTVFIARAEGIPKAGDDAAQARVITLDAVNAMEFAFDHKRILLDYIKFKNQQALEQ